MFCPSFSFSVGGPQPPTSKEKGGPKPSPAQALAAGDATENLDADRHDDHRANDCQRIRKNGRDQIESIRLDGAQGSAHGAGDASEGRSSLKNHPFLISLKSAEIPYPSMKGSADSRPPIVKPSMNKAAIPVRSSIVS